MIVESITVRSWRGFRDRHRFELQEGLNLLVGLNEAGKSTLFEVLQRTFFDRYNGSSQELKAMQPLSSSLGPEAELVVRNGEGRYRIVKRFLESAESRLYSWRTDAWELDHEGDKADARIRALLKGDLPGRGATKEEHRGLAQALWYLQREDALPSETWNAAVERGLQGMVEVVGSTPAEAALLSRVEASYSEHWTPTGRLSSKSPISELRDEIPRLEEELAKLEDRLAEAAGHRESLERLALERREKSERVASLERDAVELQDRIDQAASLAEKKVAAEGALDDLRSERTSVRERLEQIIELNGQIETAEAEVADARSALADAELEVEKARRRTTELRRRLKEDVDPRLKSLADRLQRLEALREVRELERDEARCRDRGERLDSMRSKVEGLETELTELRAPSAEELETFRETVKEMDLARARVDAAAIRVRFRLDDDVDVTPDPTVDPEDGEYLITTSTRFELPGVGEVEVSGGGADLEELHATIEELQENRDAVLARFDADDEQGLYDAHESRTRLRQDLEKLESNIETLLEDGDPADELAELRQRLRERRDSAAELDAGDLALEGDVLDRRLKSLRTDLEELADEKDELAAEQEEARDQHVEAVEAKGEADSRLRERTASEKSLREQKSKLLEQHGSVSKLETLLETQDAKVEAKEKELEELADAYAERVERPRERLEDVVEQISALQKALNQLEVEKAGLSSALETLAGENLYSRTGDLEAELELKRQRLPVLERRAEGAKVLRGLVVELLAERSGVLAGPVAERVTAWLGELTAEAYDQVELTAELKPASVRSTRYRESLDVSQLSHGTQEQLVVLLRLAIGVLLSDEEPQLVVLDDRLVNSDPVRTSRFRPILQEVCDSCQILLATCNDSAYSGLGARVVRIPDDGRDPEGS